MNLKICKYRLINRYSFIFLSLLFLNCVGSIKIVDINQNDANLSKKEDRKIYNWSISDSLILLWESEIDGGINYNSFSAFGDYIFYGSLAGKVQAINSSSGKILGKLRFNGEIFSSTIINYPQLIFVVNKKNKESEVYFYYFYSQKILSKITLSSIIKSDIIKLDDGFILALVNGEVLKFNFKGKIIWKTELKVIAYSQPTAYNDKLIIGDDKGNIWFLSLEDGKILGKTTIESAVRGGFEICKQKICALGTDGSLYLINSNNLNLEWKYKTNYKLRNKPIAINDSLLILSSLTGEIEKIDVINQKSIWKIKTNGIFIANPLIFDNLIIQPDLNKKILFINLSDGKIKKEKLFEERVKTIFLFKEDKILVGLDYGKIKAYKISKY